MNTCDKCIKHDICGIREAFGAVGCVDDFQPKPMTNADKIRNMSDEELAKVFVEIDEDYICNVFCKNICKLRNNSCPVIFKDEVCPISTEDCISGWLQSEVSDGNSKKSR